MTTASPSAKARLLYRMLEACADEHYYVDFDRCLKLNIQIGKSYANKMQELAHLGWVRPRHAGWQLLHSGHEPDGKVPPSPFGDAS